MKYRLFLAAATLVWTFVIGGAAANAEGAASQTTVTPLTESELAAEGLGTGLRLGQRATIEEIRYGFLGTRAEWPEASSYWSVSDNTTISFGSPFGAFDVGASVDSEGVVVLLFVGVQSTSDGRYVAPETMATTARIMGGLLAWNTERGCGIGDSLDNVLLAYGSPQTDLPLPFGGSMFLPSDDGSSTTSEYRQVSYASGDYQLSFSVAQGIVISVSASRRRSPWIPPDPSLDGMIAEGLSGLGLVPGDTFTVDEVTELLSAKGLFVAYKINEFLPDYYVHHRFYTGDGGVVLELVTESSKRDTIAALALIAAPAFYKSAGRAEAGSELFAAWEKDHPRIHTATGKGREYFLSKMQDLADRRLFFAPRIQRRNENIPVFRNLKYGDKAERIVEECGCPSAVVKSESGLTDIYLYVGSENTLRFHVIDGFLVDALCYATKYGHEQPPLVYAP